MSKFDSTTNMKGKATMFMPGKSKTVTPALLFFLLILPALLAASCSRGPQPPAPQKPPFSIITADNLFAVDCVDPQHIWAVGFNSVIVHTADGGKTWEFQKSGVENEPLRRILCFARSRLDKRPGRHHAAHR